MSTSVLCVPARILSQPAVFQLEGLCFHFDGDLIVLAGSSWVQLLKKERECKTETSSLTSVSMWN